MEKLTILQQILFLLGQEEMNIPWEAIAVFVATMGVFASISIYLDQKKSRRFDKMEVFNNRLREDIDNTRQELAIVRQEVSNQKEIVKRQFDIVEREQTLSKDIILKQIDELKKMIETFSNRFDKFFSETQLLNIKVAEHIAKSSQ